MNVPDFSIADELSVSIAVNYSLCLIRLGRASEAISILNPLSTIPGKPCAYYVNFSLALLQSGHAERAEDLAQEGLSLFPGDPDLLGNLTIALLQAKKLSEALQTAHQRLAIERNVHSLEEAASIFLAMGEAVKENNLPLAAEHYWQAGSLLEEAKALNPSHLTTRVNLAKMLVEVELYVDAMEETSNIWKQRLHPQLGRSVALIVARALEGLRNYREAIDLCERWLKHFPDDIELQRTRAQLFVDGFCIGKKKDGVRIVERSPLNFFEEIIQDRAKRTSADLLYLAKLHEWMGKVESGVTLANEARRESPEWWEPPFILGGFEWRRGNFETGKNLVEFASTLTPWRPEPWQFLSHIFDSAGMSEEATDAAAKAQAVAKERSKLLKRSLRGSNNF